jgi:predicted Rossmann fold nucleotide-binding protein DprA/Smf involved in DNA uptake
MTFSCTYKTAFLASRTISSDSVLKCYDWATEQKKLGRCVVSGFHSKLEKDVLHFLLKTQTPTILVLGRAPYKKLPQEFEEAIAGGLLQIISVSNSHRQTKETAKSRNEYIISIADEIVFASLNEQSSLYPLYIQVKTLNKPVTLL